MGKTKTRRKTRMRARPTVPHYVPKDHASSEEMHDYKRALKQVIIDRMAARNAKRKE